MRNAKQGGGGIRLQCVLLLLCMLVLANVPGCLSFSSYGGVYYGGYSSYGYYPRYGYYDYYDYYGYYGYYGDYGYYGYYGYYGLDDLDLIDKKLDIIEDRIDFTDAFDEVTNTMLDEVEEELQVYYSANGYQYYYIPPQNRNPSTATYGDSWRGGGGGRPGGRG